MLEIDMKWVVRAILLIYMCYKAAYGARIESSLLVEQIKYGDDGFLEVGTRKTINCKGFNRNQKLEWVDPFGKVVNKVLSNRVFAQEHFVTSPKGGRAPGLVLTITELRPGDSGIYQCRAGDARKNVSLCVIQPSEFINTPKLITADVGRSITLSCQAKGDPEPRMLWQRNGNELTEEPNHKYSLNVKYNSQGYESLLTVVDLEPEDSGIYTCISQQQSPMLDDCSYENQTNVTLNVNHEPIFDNLFNETKVVFGKPGQVVDLVCSASAYPLPTYRWFKDLGADKFYEFEQKQITYSEEENQAVLSITAGPTTFNQRYKCQASNTLGEAEQSFVLVKIEKPTKINEVFMTTSSSTKAKFNFTFAESGEIIFPVSELTVLFLEASQIERRYHAAIPKLGLYIPKEADWRRAKVTKVEIPDSESPDAAKFMLENLEPNTEYWGRVRASNSAGDGPWSEPMVFATTDASDDEIEEPVEEVEESDDPKELGVTAEEGEDSGAFFGIFFAGGIVITVVACVFFMRLV